MKKRRPGRPPVDAPRERRVAFLLTDEQFDALSEEAEALSLEPNLAARAILLQSIRARAKRGAR